MRKLKILDEVGLGYLRLGQSATTLSGGEAQRLKLAARLIHAANPGVLYIFDEPTTGLHFDDIQKLLTAFRRLLDSGASILVIEHNMDVVKCADWVIDLGPDGGVRGGKIAATGTPEQVARNPHSHTGKYLAQALKNHHNSQGKTYKESSSNESSNAHIKSPGDATGRNTERTRRGNHVAAIPRV